MDTCRHYTPHINALQHEGYEASEELQYVSGERVPLCAAPQMQMPGQVAGCSYPMDHTACPYYAPDVELLRSATSDEGVNINLYRLRLSEGVRAFRVERDGARVGTFTVHQHGNDARGKAEVCFEMQVNETRASEEEVETDEPTKTSYLEKVLA